MRTIRIWGIHKKYKGLSWCENFLGGHINLGKRITIYGENAMNWAVNISTKKGWLCFTLPTWRRILHKDQWYIYLSPNGTPTKAIWAYYSKNQHSR